MRFAFQDNSYLYADLKQLHILQVTNRLPWPLNDGGNLATHAIAKHLSALGHRVTLASLNTRKHRQDPSALSNVAEVHAVDIDTRIRPLPLALGLFQSTPYNIARFRSPAFEDLLSRLVREQRPDIVQLEGSYQALFLPAIRRGGDVPVLLRSHNVEWRIWQRVFQYERNPLKRLYLRNMYRKIRAFEQDTLHGFDGVVAITEEDEAWYKAQGFAGPITTVNAGADLSRYAPGGDWAPAFKVGFIGSMEWEPNVQGLLWFLDKVWPAVLAACPEAEFHIAGKHPPEWMDRWNELPGVRFHGMVEDAVDFLRGIRLFVVPLLSGSGMRLKIVEALAMQKCVVSTRVGAEGIRVVDGRDLLLRDQPAEFSGALISLLREPARGEALALAGRQSIQECYDWRILINRFVEFYHHFA